MASAGGDFESAVRWTLKAMVQSPRFVYRVESQRGDGTEWPVADHELAARLSYMVWGAPPDKELLSAASAGELDDDGFEKQLARMLKDPRAVDHSLRFVNDWLNLPRLQNMQPNAERFPGWDPKLATDMRDETLAFFREVIWEQNRPLSSLLDSQVAYVTPRLARHYGMNAPSDATSETGLVRVDVSGQAGRGGLLTQGSVLTVGGDDASMVTRGLLVMHELLRGVVKDPPPCVDTTPVPSKPGLTQRAIAESRIANKNCGGCHGKFEPLAFGLEKFDGLGTWHDQDEHGNALRADGEILFPGTAEPVSYKTSQELMTLLANSERVKKSLTWKVTQFVLGRPLTASDARILDTIHENAQKAGGTWSSLMMAIAESDLIRLTKTEAAEDVAAR